MSSMTQKTPKTFLMLGAAATLLAGFSATAEPVAYRPTVSHLPPSSMPVSTQNSPVKTQVLNLAKGRSAVIDLPVDASDVFVSNPAVADAVLRTPRRIFVLGVAGGQSDAIFFDAMGRQILNLNVRVNAPTDELSDTIHRLFPKSHVDTQSLNGHIILSGMAKDDGQSDQILHLAQTYVDKPDDVVNLMSIAGKDQVTLKVRIVEVNRSTIKQLGLATDITYNMGTRSYSFGRSNTFGTNGQYYGGKGACYGQNGARTNTNTNTTTDNNTTGTTANNTVTNSTNNSLSNTQSFTENHIGSTKDDPNGYNADGSARNTWSSTGATSSGTSDPTATGSAINNTSAAATNDTTGTNSALSHVISNAVSSTFSTITGTNNSSCLAAFERAGLARTLAEPNLTAVSGESAKFLAGGEFPVPVAQDNQGRITVEFKPFGVGLGFTPVVLSNGRISMKLSTEVSELSNSGAFSVNNTFTVPALDVRRAETSVEMQSGSSLMIAGLLQSKYKQTVDSMPGLTTLPVLGALFRSRDFLDDETEMVVIVTPYIVDPTDPDTMQTPADNLQTAGDLTTTFMGSLNKVTKPADSTSRANTAPDTGPYQAPVGYVIE